MAHKNGAIKNGQRQRRANRHGSLYHKGNVWYIRWSERDPLTHERKRIVESTGESDITKAREVLTKRAADLGFDNRDQAAHMDALLTAKRNIENERERLERERAAIAQRERESKEHEQRMERESKAITFSEAFIYYRESKKRPDASERTLSGYETQYQIFAAWIKRNHPTLEKIRDLTPEIAESFIDSVEKSRSRSTRNKYLIFLRTMWRALRWNENAQLTIDPWEGIKTLTVKVDEVEHKDFTVEQLMRIGNVFASGQPVSGHRITNVYSFNGTDIKDELRVLFAIGIFTGQRLGDCATIKWEDIDTISKRITFRPQKTWRRYKREVTTHIHPCLYGILDEYATDTDKTGYILPTVADIYTNREPSMLTNRIQAIIRAADIETQADNKAYTAGAVHRIQYGFHSLRHFFNSYLKNHGVNDSIVDYLVCHNQGTVEARYYHDNAAAIENAVKTIPAIPQFAKDSNAVAISNSKHSATNTAKIKRLREMVSKAHDILMTLDREERENAITLIKNTLSI